MPGHRKACLLPLLLLAVYGLLPGTFSPADRPIRRTSIHAKRGVYQVPASDLLDREWKQGKDRIRSERGLWGRSTNSLTPRSIIRSPSNRSPELYPGAV
jgi:hypothetical protein